MGAGGQGIWPAFWMLPNYPWYGGWPISGEIDIMERVNSDPFYYTTLHMGNPHTFPTKTTNVPNPTVYLPFLHLISPRWLAWM
jgi:beta-glucanase (GH16 family)